MDGDYMGSVARLAGRMEGCFAGEAHYAPARLLADEPRQWSRIQALTGQLIGLCPRVWVSVLTEARNEMLELYSERNSKGVA